MFNQPALSALFFGGNFIERAPRNPNRRYPDIMTGGGVSRTARPPSGSTAPPGYCAFYTKGAIENAV